MSSAYTQVNPSSSHTRLIAPSWRRQAVAFPGGSPDNGRMEAQYHRQMLQDVLAPYFSAADLQTIIRANLGQDSLLGLLRPVYHFDDSLFAAGEAYIAAQRQTAVAAITSQQNRNVALQAFGRLLHGRQDFYAHSDWVPRWVAAHGGPDQCRPADIAICPDATAVPGLTSGKSALHLYVLYRVPLFGPLLKRVYFPPDTHEAMNLDYPARGPLFPFAIAAASKHTQAELDVLLAELQAKGGETAVNRFLAKE